MCTTRRASMERKEARKEQGSSSSRPRPRRAKTKAKEPADRAVSCDCPLDDDTPGDPWTAMR